MTEEEKDLLKESESAFLRRLSDERDLIKYPNRPVPQVEPAISPTPIPEVAQSTIGTEQPAHSSVRRMRPTQERVSRNHETRPRRRAPLPSGVPS